VAVNFDPIAKGFVQSLARPGGNITGIVSLQMELVAKQLELLTQAFPERKRVGALWDELSADQFRAAEREAHAPTRRSSETPPVHHAARRSAAAWPLAVRVWDDRLCS
jgi:ABC transporter substrate binding protein